jgi:Cu+-exporting ATPase
MQGVQQADVNLASEKVQIAYDGSAVSIAELAARLDEYGFTLHLPEPDKSVSTQQQDLHRKKDDGLKKDLLLSIGMGMPVMLLSMGMMWAPVAQALPFTLMQANIFFMLASALILAIPGRRFFVPAIKQLRHGASDMNTLVSLGTGIAWLYSAALLLMPEIDAQHAYHHDAQHLYFDSSVSIITLILLGRWLEHRTKSRAGDALAALMRLKPATALIRQPDGSFSEQSIDTIQPGDRLLVRQGATIPADGIILQADYALVDESMITGESMPVQKQQGSRVIGGTISINSSFEMRATVVGAQSTLSRIMQAVEKAQGSKAAIQSVADKISSIFVPTVTAIAILTFFIWYTVLDNSLNSSIMPAIAVLLIACPCALGLATPTAITAATGTAAKLGIILRNAAALEKAGHITLIAADKTGTITQGNMQIDQIFCAAEYTQEYMLQIAASIEQYSQHPIAAAFLRKAQNISLFAAEQVQEIPGKGVYGQINGMSVLLGTYAWLKEYGIQVQPDIPQSDGTIIALAIEHTFAGCFILRDIPRPEAASVVHTLERMKAPVLMLSGDQIAAVEYMAKNVGIKEYKAGILPGGKAQIIRELQQKGHSVAMLGDGINDAPALAQANLGIAMGSGTDIAMSVADITLLGNSLAIVPAAIALSRRTMHIIYQNFFWAFIFNIIGIPLAAMGILNPMIAAAAMAFSSISVITNSLRLRRITSDLRIKAIPQ